MNAVKLAQPINSRIDVNRVVARLFFRRSLARTPWRFVDGV
jgi:hypothetical protein